ncbi:MAG: cytochrome c oxidase subunit II [Acidobacteriaceae bacterium]
MLRSFRNLASIASLLALTGCRVALSTFNPHGPAAHRIADLSWIMTILFLVISLVMWILFAYAFYRRRGSLAEHEPVESGGGEMWIAIGGLVIPFIVLTALFVAGLSLLSDFPIRGAGSRRGLGRAEMAQSMKPDILVIGHQWWWEIRYLNDDPAKEFTTANELHLPAGRPVNIELKSADVIHSFWIPALDGKMDMIPGQPNYLRLIASQPGTYAGQCATFCGAQHALMRLIAVVQTPANYQAWLDNQLKPGAVPTTPEAKAGEEIFVNGPCALCHAVRGTGAGGVIGPDLTHIGSRKMLASDVYDNNNAYLEAWIINAQSLKPKCEMPNLPQFSGVQLNELVAYLRQLK